MGVKVTADNLDQETFKNSLCIAIRSKVLFPDFLNIADLSYFETKKKQLENMKYLKMVPFK